MSASDWKGPAFRRTLVAIVRKSVPERDVEDIVQATLTEALSPSAPTEEGALQRWLIGVARHKIVDRHRQGRRESFEVPEVSVDAPPHSENDLVRWAKGALPADGEEPKRTLEWMMREGDGEKLESIAESEQLPAPRVRKRVSRLRSHLRAQWQKELALLAAIGVVATIVWLARQSPQTPIARDLRPVPREVAPTPLERGRRVREEALAACNRQAWIACLDGLDRARELDPVGDADDLCVKARAAAETALRPAPLPAPTTSAPPMPAPSSEPTSGPPAPRSTSTAPDRGRRGKTPSLSGSSL